MKEKMKPNQLLLYIRYVTLSLFLGLFAACQSDNTNTGTTTEQESVQNLFPDDDYFFVGTYTRKESHVNGQGKGIYVYRMNRETGELNQVSVVENTINPSFVAIHPSKKYLFAVNEHDGDDAFQEGTISAFSINPSTKSLTFLNKTSAKGIAPCYISVGPKGKYAYAANYGTGNITMLPIDENGKIGEATDVAQHTGKGKHPRQESAHAHYIQPNGSYVTAIDLGTDKIINYLPDLNTGKLRNIGQIPTPAGAGPRHLATHPSRLFSYIVNELNGTIILRGLNGSPEDPNGEQVVSTLPKGYKGTPACADIHVSPNGKFLYASNRGDLNDIVIFSIDQTTGQLTFVNRVSTQGQTPRNFVIHPNGKFLLAANQDSNNIVVFSIDEASGNLEPTGEIENVGTPVCLKFL